MLDFVKEVWGIVLLDWQAEDLWKFFCGGIYSYSLPTDHGKSMLLELACVLRYVVNPDRRFILVKINDDAAKEVCVEICRRLLFVSTELRHNGAPLYPMVEPQVVWRGNMPWGISKGFDIAGRDFRDRNINPSFRSASVGSRDLQGKRGDTAVDDVERMEEAESEAYRKQLKMHMEGIFRTLEDKPDALWMIVGTAFHGDSIYDYVTRKLDGLDVRHERIVRPLRNEDGSFLWPERARKSEIHKRLMSKTAYAAAYELTPVTGRPMTKGEVEHAVRDYSLPRVDHERQLVQVLRNWAMQVRIHEDPFAWQQGINLSLERELALYVGWDPATTGDWAVVTLAMWGEDIFLLRAHVGVGDTWEQLLAVRDAWLPFPSAVVVVETNGQQKAFKELAQQDVALSQTQVHVHGTGSNKHDHRVGIPGLMATIRQGYLHETWGDADWAESEYVDIEEELASYGATSHPHALLAVWFAWRRHRRLFAQESVRRKLEERSVVRETGRIKIEVPRPKVSLPGPGAALRRSTREAWHRRHRRQV